MQLRVDLLTHAVRYASDAPRFTLAPQRGVASRCRCLSRGWNASRPQMLSAYSENGTGLPVGTPARPAAAQVNGDRLGWRRSAWRGLTGEAASVAAARGIYLDPDEENPGENPPSGVVPVTRASAACEPTRYGLSGLFHERGTRRLIRVRVYPPGRGSNLSSASTSARQSARRSPSPRAVPPAA